MEDKPGSPHQSPEQTWVSTETLQATFLADPGLSKQTGTMT